MRYIAISAALALLLGCPTTGGQGGRQTGNGDGAAPRGPTVEDVVALEVKRPEPDAFRKFLAATAPEPIRARATLSVARLLRLSAWPLLKELSQDPSLDVRVNAVFGLGQLDLALNPADERHEALRAEIEAELIGRLMTDDAPRVRAAVITALGRVARGPGVENLVVLARGTGADRVDALVALGVSGARAKAPRSSDTALLVAVDQALKAADPRLRRAAAYAAFRQKLPISDDRLVTAARDADPQVRIHVARAMGEVAAKPASPATLLADADWRVRVEAVRAAAAIARRGSVGSVGPLRDAGIAAATRLAGAPATQGHEAHVVREVCMYFSDPEVAVDPVEAVGVAETLHELLGPAGNTVSAARCACAASVDALRGEASRVKSCAPNWPADRARKVEIEMTRRLRISSRERVLLLSTFLSDTSPAVRTAAAWALAAEATSHAARAAATRLEVEEHPAVAAALLTLFTGDNADALEDGLLGRVVQRFASATTLEAAEPLLEAARRLQGRTTPSAGAARATLASHSEPRVRDVIAHTHLGDAAPGPRARDAAPPGLAELPLAAILRTERGDIRVQFERDLAPVAVANFAALARKGFFNNVRFHRVIGDFVAQGGDPTGTGSGGPGYTIPCEGHDLPYSRGAVGVALAGQDTGGSQFFLTHSEQRHLDGRYTIFARVVDGWGALDALQPEDRLLSVDFASALPAR